MAYITTPDLGLELADPTTIQAFETTNVNSNFLLLEAGIIADRVDIAAAETAIDTLEAGAGRGTLANHITSTLSTLHTLAPSMTTGDLVTVNTISVGVARHLWERVQGGAPYVEPVGMIFSNSKTEMDNHITAVNAAGANLGFRRGNMWHDIGTSTTYRFTDADGAYKPVTAGRVPYVRLTVTTKSIANSSAVKVGTTAPDAVYVEVADALGFHDAATNPTRVTPNIPGRYRAMFQCNWANNGTGGRRAVFYKNGTIVQHTQLTHLSSTDGLVGPTVFLVDDFNGTTDYLEVEVLQSSGGALNLSGLLTVELVDGII